ncbi:hypothetical protein OKW40_002329 [Paraburkholderia sp. RAU6.4a]|nr:hypothetical protein [Paraburkholderia sp. HC6.4b]
MTPLCVLQRGIASVSGQSQSAKDQEKRLRALFFRPSFEKRALPGAAFAFRESPVSAPSRHLLSGPEVIHYNTGHFGAGNTLARRVIEPASPRNCRQEIYS